MNCADPITAERNQQQFYLSPSASAKYRPMRPCAHRRWVKARDEYELGQGGLVAPEIGSVIGLSKAVQGYGHRDLCRIVLIPIHVVAVLFNDERRRFPTFQ